jgi:F-type H+-transporting ATPase subunit epsilon
LKLKILLPSHVFLDEPVQKVIAEAENGHFCLLPRHVDFTAALVPGILSWVTREGDERFAAVDEGVLVKCGAEILVSTRNAVRGSHLGVLKQTVDEVFRHLDEQERKSRSALARMEADFARRFWELGRHG